jgi:hypothetical protein
VEKSPQPPFAKGGILFADRLLFIWSFESLLLGALCGEKGFYNFSNRNKNGTQRYGGNGAAGVAA